MTIDYNTAQHWILSPWYGPWRREGLAAFVNDYTYSLYRARVWA